MYTKANTITRLVLSFAAIVLWQGLFNPVTAQSSIEGNNFDKTIRMYDENGRPLTNAAIDAQGTPYFLSNWKMGAIRLTDSRVFTAVPLKLDLEQQEVHYKRADGTDIDIQPGQVKQITITDTIAGILKTYQFLSGLPPIDNQTETSFYLLLDSGRVSLLESLRKKLYQEKNAYAANFVKEYRMYNDFYVVSDGKLVRIKKDLKFFQQVTSDKQAQISDYLTKNKVSFKSLDDIQRLIHYYNGLP
jgi:hypothetical protein